MANTFVTVLKYRDFLKIWVSQISSQIALHMLNFAIVLHIYELTGSVTAVSLVLVASAVPSVIFGPFSGAIADRLNYKTILTWTSFLRFAAILLLFVMKDNVLALLEIVFLISLISQFFAPAEMAAIPLIVPKKKLVAANSVIMTTMYAALLVGYSAAGPIMILISTKWLFLFCGLLYLVSAFVVNRMTNFDTKKVKKLILTEWAKEIEVIWGKTKEGIKYVKENRKIYDPMLKLACGWAMLGSFIVLMPSFGESILNISAKLIGPAIIAPAGLGMFLGAYVLDKRKNITFNKIINRSFFILGLFLIIFSSYLLYDELFISRAINIFAVIGLGLLCSFIYISAQTLLHLKSERKKRGRVFGISAMLINIAMALPALIVGGVSDVTSPLFAMALISFVIIVYGTALLFEEG